MKKKLILILIIIVSIFTSLFIYKMNNSYEIIVENVDKFSPDRRLTVTKNNKKVEYKLIKYTDGEILCYGDVPIVSNFDIKDVKRLIVVLNNDKEINVFL